MMLPFGIPGIDGPKYLKFPSKNLNILYFAFGSFSDSLSDSPFDSLSD